MAVRARPGHGRSAEGAARGQGSAERGGGTTSVPAAPGEGFFGPRELSEPGQRRSPAWGLVGSGWARQGEVRRGRGVRKPRAAAPAPPGRAAAPGRAAQGHRPVPRPLAPRSAARALRRDGCAQLLVLRAAAQRRSPQRPRAAPAGTAAAPPPAHGRGGRGAGRVLSVRCRRRRRSAIAGGRRCRHVGAGRGGPGPGHHPGVQVTTHRSAGGPVPPPARCRCP